MPPRPAHRRPLRRLVRIVGSLVLAAAWVQGASAAPLKLCVVPDKSPLGAAGCVPFGQLQARLDSIGSADNDRQITSIDVLLKAGTYELSQALVIGKGRAGAAAVPLTIRGETREKTILRGSKTLPLVAVREAPSASGAARRPVAFADLADSSFDALFQSRAWLFGRAEPTDADVFIDGQRLARARFPQSGYARIASVRKDGALLKLRVEGVDVSAAGALGLRIGGFFFHDWAHEIFPVDSVDSSGEITIANKLPTYGARAGGRVWLDNLPLSQSGVPGWQLDAASRRLNVRTGTPQPPSQVNVGVALAAFNIDGAQNLTIADLTIDEFLGDAIAGSGVSAVAVRNLRLRNIGATAIKLSGSDITVERCAVADLGASGIVVTAGDRKSLRPGGAVIRGNLVERSGLYIRTYAAAVVVNGVGALIEDNVLKDGPHAAIVYHGNDHVIRGNRISDFVQDTDDAGAIYTGRDWTARGTVISNNVITRIGRKGTQLKFSASAIYLDDQASGQTVTNNVLVDVDRGILLGGGRDNIVTGNIIDARGDAIYMDARGLGVDDADSLRKNQGLISQLVAQNVEAPPYSVRYPELARLMQQRPGAPLGNVFSGNWVGAGSALAVKPNAEDGLQRAGNLRFDADDTLRRALSESRGFAAAMPSVQGRSRPAERAWFGNGNGSGNTNNNGR